MGVTSVTLGNFFTTSTGKTILGGAGGSGLDTQALLSSVITAASLPATHDQANITINNNQTSALNTFQNLLSSFQTSANALSNPVGISSVASNVWDFTTGSVGNGGSPYVSITTTPGATLQTYNISNITTIAAAASQGTGTFYVASANADATVNDGMMGHEYFVPGTIDLAGGASVPVNSGDSLNTIAASFNAVSAQSGINATVIQVSASQYQLSFTAVNTGTNANFDLTDTSPTTTVTSGASVLAHIGLTTALPGTNAQFDLNNIPITRQTNSISDLVNGVTFNILQGSSPSDVVYPVTVSPDTTTIQNTINSFVNSYNAIQTFATTQTQLNSSGTYTSGAVLSNNQSFREVMNDLNAGVLATVSGISGTNPSSLAGVGITLTNQPASSTTPEVNNVLTVDDGALTSALSSSFQAIKNVFGFNLTSNNANLSEFSHTNALTATQFTLTINTDTPGSPTFVATFASGPPVDMTGTALAGGSGYELTGPTGSVLEGLNLLYVSTADATISVHATQGIADQTNNTISSATKANTGTIAVALTGLQTNDTSLQSDITRVKAQVAQYQTQLLAQFAAMEQAVASTNTLLQSINANENAALSSSGN